MTPPTNLRIEILESASEPPQRSIAMLSAWRTRIVVEGLARGVEDDHQVVDPGALEHR